jgi:hypothetical protein
MYFEYEEQEIDSFTLGEGYFGKYGSGEGSRSVTCKQRVKEKIRGKTHSD